MVQVVKTKQAMKIVMIQSVSLENLLIFFSKRSCWGDLKESLWYLCEAEK